VTTRAAATTRAALASVGVALLLLGLKGWAVVVTASVAMLGSLFDSAIDLIASLVTLWAVRIAAAPADHDHRFGHGKAEALAALFQAGLIAVSAVGICWQAADRLLSGATSAQAEYGIAVSLAAIAATLALTFYQRSIIRRTGSIAIEADRVHYQSDLLLNVAVIAALALEQYVGVPGADPLFGIAIALWLLWSGWRASRRALDQLMDREWPDARRLAFLAVAARHPANRGTHDLRTRSSGAHEFAQFHIFVDPAMTVEQAHRVMEDIETDLAAEFPGVEVLIHVDPEGQVDAPGNALVESVELKLTKETRLG
jgi:ferrous-iron efflux pump FieF